MTYKIQDLTPLPLVAKWLARYMLRHDDLAVPENQRETKALGIAEWFGSEEAYDRFRTHGRPIRYPELKALGLRVRRLEDDSELQDAVLSIFHANEITFNGPAAKVIENHLNHRMVVVEQNIALQPATPSQPGGQLSRQQRRALERKRK